jgi:hypothetical protein
MCASFLRPSVMTVAHELIGAYAHITISQSIGVSVDVDCTHSYLCVSQLERSYSRSSPSCRFCLCRIPVPYSTSISTTANRHGHRKASQVRLRCSPDNVVTRGFSERVRCEHGCPVDIRLSLSSQVVLVYRDRYVCLQNRCCKRSADLIHSYAKWTPGNPGQSRRSYRELFG